MEIPTYNFRDKTTGREWEEYCSFSDHDRILSDPNIEQVVCAPSLGNVTQKPDGNFNDLLKHIKKRAGVRANMNTF
jgi:hypothetical protein